MTDLHPETDTDTDTDPFLWLEAVDGADALRWVETENAITLDRLETDPRFARIRQDAEAVYNATDKIAYGALQAGMVHNFWQDDTHVRGLWRCSDLDSYAAGAPDWQTVLDIDALAESEGENWVYAGREWAGGTSSRWLIRLSRGGGDAVVVREFDSQTRQYVDGGFVSPEAKQSVAWLDADTLLIATDFGPDTMNASGYARQVRRWQRSRDLMTADLLIDGGPDTVFNMPLVSKHPDHRISGVLQGLDFFTQRVHILDAGGVLQALDLPVDIDVQGFFGPYLVFLLRKDWAVADGTVHQAGTLIFADVAALLDGRQHLISAAPSQAGATISSVTIGRDRVYITELSDVTASAFSLQVEKDGRLVKTPIALPAGGTLSVVSADAGRDLALINYEGYLTPSTLYLLRGTHPEVAATLPARFDSDGLVVEQKFAASKDGTRIPYFLIRAEHAPLNGTTPTLLYGYGGFEISLTPGYLAGVSRQWVQEGGAYVVANIRGGGEYGPAWHQAALRENRQRAFDDFIAVAEDLIASGVTSPEQLGIRGGSNGGLLMGAMTTQRPDLFGAVICAVPLLDMRRFHLLLAGASWVGEYGNPDTPEDWAFIAPYSPYQNLRADADYPEVFYYTSTKDDRVHPGHARKMAAKTASLGHARLYYEITDGGHAAAANLNQRAFTDALQLVYLLQTLMD